VDHGPTAADLSSKWWFDVAFLGFRGSELEVSDEGGDEVDDISAQASSDGTINSTIDGEQVSDDQVWPKWTQEDEGFFSQPWVWWFRVITDLVDLDSGAPHSGSFFSSAMGSRWRPRLR
jgi:hypothetical protein